MADKVTVHMIGNAHIDPVWLWRWQEGYAEALATCRSALDRMNETPDFVFTRADAATYRWIEESDPGMFEEIRRRVAEGRWSIVGGWWEQPDCNIPSGESFARHALYGKRYFLDKFGVDVKVGYNVDSFGHNGGLPQILKESGIDCYVFFRPGSHEKDLPGMLFRWQGPSGASVLACRPSGHYCTGSEDIAYAVKSAIEARPKGLSHTVCFYGVGNHGGGPTKRNIASVQEMNRRERRLDVRFSSLDGFFAAVSADERGFPVVAEDLQHHAVGCYSANSEMKRLNRRMENLLVTSEKFTAAASVLLGRPYPREALSEAWKTLLFCQFHDILAGTSTPEAYEDVRDDLGSVSHAASHAMNAALQAMALRIDTRGEGRPFVVFNPHPWPVKAPVVYEERVRSLSDENGDPVPSQRVSPAEEHSAHRPPNIFLADLPPFGYRLYRASDEPASPGGGVLEAGEGFIGNEFWSIRINRENGWITSILDRRRNAEMLSEPASPVVMADFSDTWSHDVVTYGHELGRFCGAQVSVVESGPVRAVIRIESRFFASTLRQDLALCAGSELIECRCTVDWHEKHKVLKLSFPFAVQDPVSTYDSAYSFSVRDTDGAENPGQMWVDVSGKLGGGDYGVALLNDCKYGFDVLDSELRMTVLRSPIYAFHDPRQVEPRKQYKYMDEGKHDFAWALVPHTGTWNQSEVVKRAVVMNAPPVTVETHQHAGPWPGRDSWLELPENVLLGALKIAEDDDAPVLRLYEHSGAGCDCRARCFGRGFAVRLSAYQLKTLKLLPQEAEETDILERTKRDK